MRILREIIVMRTFFHPLKKGLFRVPGNCWPPGYLETFLTLPETNSQFAPETRGWFR